jgi:hypothetical protein
MAEEGATETTRSALCRGWESLLPTGLRRGWSEKAIMNEYHRAYRSAIGEDPWAPPQILR